MKVGQTWELILNVYIFIKKTQEAKDRCLECYRKECVELSFKVWPDRRM
jgi:hypothetical protein